jgi:hypothetical protein
MKTVLGEDNAEVLLLLFSMLSIAVTVPPPNQPRPYDRSVTESRYDQSR